MRIEHKDGTVLLLGRLRDGGMVLTAQELGEVVQSVELVLDPEEVAQVAEYLISAGERARQIRARWPGISGSEPDVCPVCGDDPAPNAPPGDRRCGLCHNFELVELTAKGKLRVEIPFERWAEKLVDEATVNQNLENFCDWLHRLRLAHHTRTESLDG